MCTYALMLHQCTRCKYVQPATRATILQPCPNEARCVTATPISEVRNDVLCERVAGPGWEAARGRDRNTGRGRLRKRERKRERDGQRDWSGRSR
ncbi:7d1c538f-fc16-486e-8a17-96acf8ec289c [Thermothielavioides terrestris]|uniref:7d1c538f-fc16-486e-8a17-96acf8ec289c n=1 Tax=Thermothielavioides terrestris TaxID=2587410 RepID=A0A3S4BHF5_9PEZI|nr:7d1c538f-fc16-486e-8a17-96acf8ec289c [Thermothielavioides terrestris]